MLPEEFESAVKKVLATEGLDLKIIFRELEKWDEAIFFISSILNEKEKSIISIQETFRIEYLLENGNVITLLFTPGLTEDEIFEDNDDFLI